MISPVILYLLNIILLAAETLMVPLFAGGFFHKKSTPRFHLISLSILLLLVVLNAVLLDSFLVLRLFCSILIWSLWIFLNYKQTFIKCFFIAVLLASFQILIDNAFLLFINLFTNGASTFDDPYAYYSLCYSAKLLELFIVILIHSLSKRKLYLHTALWSDWFRVVFIPLSTLLISFFFTSILLQSPHLSSKLLYCTVILLGSDFAAIFLLNYLERQQREKIENTVLLQNIKLEYEHVMAMKEAYASQRKQTHDFQNQLSVLRSLANRSASQNEFVQYLDQILSEELPSIPCINTNRPVVDAILSQKSAVAHSKEICFQQNLDNLADYPLPDDALVIVLTNLIDNAIEACEQIQNSDQRRILLKMQTTPDGSFLYIENTTATPVLIRGTQIASTKANPLAHGFGLKNVYAMLDRQKALYAIDYREADNTFCFSAKIKSS